jgi:ankyrin repeat protein
MAKCKTAANVWFLSGLLLAFTNCVNSIDRSPRGARDRLREMGIEYDTTAFIENAGKGRAEEVRLFLDAGMDPNVTNEEGETALMEAAAMGYCETMQTLLARGASVKVRDLYGESPLSASARVGSPETLEILLNAGAEINSRDRDGWTPLICAALYGNYQGTATLTDCGANINAQDEAGNTAIILLARSKQASDTGFFKNLQLKLYELDPLKTVRLLLDKGADVSIKNKEGKTALMFAEERGNTQMIELLKQAGAAQ